ncbi:MAG: tRNA (adenosine(37)-N6)-threonylcarbamoyltransferase complex ATPase subunit type 1 TsaE [Candidatus Magnetoovum sp. WYHC-5]|nr:tRNA (adenosine(37)-N6)-threonylcarbamoyltransferase complex ATPase subunit type 1 TsaE [Candidatus Magnetoovum sp. WYHC-5]
MKIITNSAQDTITVGFKLGSLLNAGDRVCLYGELGSGKTTLIKGIAEAFGINRRDITSASFTIIAEYETQKAANIPFYHIDLYRLDNVQTIEETGFFDYPGPDGVCVIEWAERVRGLIDCTLCVQINCLDGDQREIIIEGVDETHWHNH